MSSEPQIDATPLKRWPQFWWLGYVLMNQETFLRHNYQLIKLPFILMRHISKEIIWRNDNEYFIKTCWLVNLFHDFFLWDDKNHSNNITLLLFFIFIHFFFFGFLVLFCDSNRKEISFLKSLRWKVGTSRWNHSSKKLSHAKKENISSLAQIF